MNKQPNKVIFKTDTLQLTQTHNGYWLYDYTVGMNLAMRADTEQVAFIKALEYYQRRTKRINNQYNSLKTQVSGFVVQFVNDEDNITL